MRKDDSNQQLCDRYFLEIKEEGAERSHIDDLAFQASVLRRAAVPVGRYFLIHLNREYVRAGELGIEQEPMAGCVCIYTGRSAQCSTFKYSHPDVPNYSVHDLARIGNSKKKLAMLVERRVFRLDDVPADIELSDIQMNQVRVHRTGGRSST